MSRVKVSDLEVTKRDIPLLVYVEPAYSGWRSTNEAKLPLLHISRRNGIKRFRSGFGRSFNVTACNRPLEYTNVYHHGILDLDNYRLCLRCSKEQAAFETVLAEYHEKRAVADRRHKEKQERKEQERWESRQELGKRLGAFSSEFFENLPVAYVGPAHEPYALHVEYKGRLYEIQEVNE